MYSVAVVAVLSAPLYMLIMAKVHKKGAVLLTFSVIFATPEGGFAAGRMVCVPCRIVCLTE